MKKLLLALGTLAAVAAPVASVIACGSSDDNSTSFAEANEAQAVSLSGLGDSLAMDIIKLPATITKTEINGDEVRYTYDMTATDDAEDEAEVAPTEVRITVNVDTKELVKVETKTADTEYKDETADHQDDFDAVELSLAGAFNDAKEVVSPAATETTTETTAITGTDATKTTETEGGNTDTTGTTETTGPETTGPETTGPETTGPETTVTGEMPTANDEAIAAAEVLVQEILTKTGYEFTDPDDQEELAVYLAETAEEGSTLSLGSVLPGQKDDDSHGDDDFAVIIDSTKLKDVTEETLYEKLGGGSLVFKETAADGTTKSVGVGEGIGSSATGAGNDQNDKWGYTDDALTNARFVIWLQHSTAEDEIGIGEMIHFNGEVFEGDQPGVSDIDSDDKNSMDHLSIHKIIA